METEALISPVNQIDQQIYSCCNAGVL
jgi:hypothetical protein